MGLDQARHHHVTVQKTVATVFQSLSYASLCFVVAFEALSPSNLG